jgi:hypothetical protein
MKKILSLSSIFAAIVIFFSSCSTPPPPDMEFNLGSDDPYRQGQNLVEAIAHGANSAAYRLMERGAPLNYQDKKDKWTPLIYAIYHNNWRMAKVLIRAGANVNLADSANRTPLMWAAVRNSGVTATILVEHGANVNAVDINGRTALQYAIIYTNYTLAAYLAEAGRRPSGLRRKKEQFIRLEDQRKREKAAAEELKLFGAVDKEKLSKKLQEEAINKNVKKPIDPKKTVIATGKNATSKIVKTAGKNAAPDKVNTVKPAVTKAAPAKAEKPVKITDILNASSSETTAKAKTPAAPAEKTVKPGKPVPKATAKKTVKPEKSEPTEYVKPMRLIMPKNTKKKKPGTTTIKVAPNNPLAPGNSYMPSPNPPSRN